MLYSMHAIFIFPLLTRESLTSSRYCALFCLTFLVRMFCTGGFVVPVREGCATLNVVCVLNDIVIITEFVGNGFWLVGNWIMLVLHEIR